MDSSINYNTFVCYDFETVGWNGGKAVDPKTNFPIQLAAKPIDNRRLTIIEDLFATDIRPPDISLVSEDDIVWHSKNRGCTKEEFIESLEKAPSIEQVLGDFENYCMKYNYKKTKWTAPIPCGHNINSFDNLVMERMRALYSKDKEKPLFHSRDFIDSMNLSFLFYENLQEPKSYGMDVLRPFYGIEAKDGHTASKDVEDCCAIIVKFMRLIRETAKKVRFKGAFANEANQSV